MEAVEATLKNVTLFSEFSQNELAQLASLSRTREYKPGEVIVKEGERGTAFYYLLNGEVEVMKGMDEPVVRVLATQRSGEYFGEMALLENDVRSASVVARTDVECLLLPGWEFMSAVRTHPDMAIKMLRVLSQRLRATERALTE